MEAHVNTITHSNSPGALWRVCKRRWMLAAAIVLATWTIGPHLLRVVANRYEAMLRLKIEADRPAVPVFEGVEAGRQENNILQTMCGVIGSEQVLGPVIERLHLQDRWSRDGQRVSMEQAIRSLRRSVTARATRDSALLELAVTDTDPRLAADIANTIGDVFRRDRLEARREQSINGVAGLRAALAEQEQRMRAAQEKLAALRKTADMPSAASEHVSDESIRQIGTDLIHVRIELADRTARIDALRDIASRHRYDELSPLVNDGTTNALAQKLSDTELWLSLMKERYGNDHPQLRTARAERDLLATRLDERLTGLVAGYCVEASALQARADNLAKQLNDAKVTGHTSEDARFIPLRNAQRDEERETKFYETLSERLQKTEIQLQIPSVPVDIVDRAQVPPAPMGASDIETQTSSLMVGLILAALITALLESFDTSLRTSEDIERHVKLPVVGILPRGIKPLTSDIAPSAHVEAYRVLRNNLEFSRLDGSIRSLCVVSAGTREGKSLTVANLAATYAQSGQRVLVVDTDLRRPATHKIFGLPNTAGFAQVLDGTREIADVALETSVPNVWLLPSGGENLHGMLIESSHMAHLVKAAGARFDVVLYDTPPVLAVSDAVVVAREVGLALLVVRSEGYSRHAIRRAKLALSNAGSHVIGVALNAVAIRSELVCSGYHNDSVSFRARRSQAEQSRLAPGKPRGMAA